VFFKKEPQKNLQEEKNLWEFIKSLLMALVIAFSIRSVLFQPFNIPSGSMKDGLLIGDFLFVSKYSYGYSKHSFPLSMGPFKGRVMAKMPERGDVAVFVGPYDPETNYIKRVIGFPGDRIQMKDGILHINDRPCPIEAAGTFEDDLWESRQGEGRVRAGDGVSPRKIPVYIETLPNGVRHRILKLQPFGEGVFDDTQEYTVPDGHLFMMGDNRDESGDSRALHQIGFVPIDHLVGRAEIIFFSTNASWWEVWRWPFAVRWSRLFKRIR
jgi:signal peptidase I